LILAIVSEFWTKEVGEEVAFCSIVVCMKGAKRPRMLFMLQVAYLPLGETLVQVIIKDGCRSVLSTTKCEQIAMLEKQYGQIFTSIPGVCINFEVL
jgi:hypothetical protein